MKIYILLLTLLITAIIIHLLFRVIDALNDAPYKVVNAQKLPFPISHTVFTGAATLNEELRDRVVILAKGAAPGQETAVVHEATGNIYLFDHFGWMHIVYSNGTTEQAVWYTGGRILGAEFMDSDRIVACDVGRGLVELTLSTRGIRVLSSRSDSDGVPILYPNDVTVSHISGLIYFSDSAAIAPWRKQSGGWATLEASFLTIFSGVPTGRLLSYDPISKRTTTLANDLLFANGVALSHDEAFVLVASTFSLRISRVLLTGEHAGSIDVFSVLHCPPDGISLASDGGFWVACPAIATRALTVAGALPWVRQVLGRLPSWMWPKSAKIGAVIKLAASGAIESALYDSQGTAVSFVSAVKEFNGSLYLGQLRGDSLPVVRLGPGPSSSSSDGLPSADVAAQGMESSSGQERSEF